MELRTGFPEAMMKLQRFQTRLALAWEGNINQRSGALDADAYAFELKRSEHARLMVNRELEKVLSELAETAFKDRPVIDPLFVLPVDDFDLNPRLCIKLLKLLRMISVPRLFSVLMGDLKVVELIMKMKTTADFQDICEPNEFLGTMTDDVQTVTARVAGNALRKLLPPHQRVHLEGMDVEEAFNFVPIGLDEKEPEKLSTLIAKIPINIIGEKGLDNFTSTISGQKISSLQDFLTINKIAVTQSDTMDMAYWARSLLATSPRRIVDIWMEFRQITDNPSESLNKNQPDSPATIIEKKRIWEKCIDFFVQYATDSINEDSEILPYHRKNLIERISKTPEGIWDISRLPIQTYPILKKGFEVKSKVFEGKAPLVKVLFNDGWEVTAIDSQDTRDPWTDVPKEIAKSDAARSQPVSQQTAAAIILLHDILALGLSEDKFESSFMQSKPSNVKIFGSWANANWGKSENQSHDIKWPAPPFRSLWEVDLFLSAWEDVIKNLVKISEEESGLSVEALAFAWISIGTAIIDGQHPVKLTGWSPKTNEWKDLSKLLNQIADNITQTSPETSLTARWLMNIAILIMPECGVPSIRNFPVEGNLLKFWKKNLSSIRHRRTNRLESLEPTINKNYTSKLRAEGEKRLGLKSK
jgi:hypothetical protein